MGSRKLYGVAVLALAAACSGEVGAPGDGAGGASGSADSASAGTDLPGGPGGPGDPGDPGNPGNPGDPGIPGADGYLASESVARRLSRAELDNTLRDVLGDDTSPASQLLPEDPFAPFDNDYTQQLASGALVDTLERLSEEVALRVLADSTLRGQIVPCSPTGPDDAACLRQVITNLGRRMLRRPLGDAEIDTYMAFQDFATEDNPDVDNGFDTAVELVIRALVFDPEFLYRIEVGTPTATAGVFALDDYEVATRMSYLVWGSAPDDALLEAADRAELGGIDGRRTQVQRMLSDSRARDQLHRFHAMWLGYRVIPHPPELTRAFDMETTALLDRVIFDEPQSYLNLFTSTETYLNDMLADHYGLPHPSGGEGWVDYGDSGRAGLLSHGSVLASFSKFSDTSPTQRGILVRTRLMCETIPPPPLDVIADKPPGGEMDAVCKEDRYSMHRTATSCAGCHSQMDPIGFGLENYDMAGRYREHDEGMPECTIAGQGELVPYGTFSGPAELGQLLVDEGIIESCVVKQLFAFALGRSLQSEEQAAADALTTQFAGADHQLAALIEDYVTSDAFALRKEPEVP